MSTIKMFVEVADEYLATPSKKYGKSKPHVAHIRVNQMAQAWRLKRIDQISRKSVEKFFTPLRKSGIAGATFNSYVTYYRAMMHFAQAKGYVDFVVPMSRVPEVQRVTYLEPYEIERLISALDPLRGDMVKFAVSTGLRRANVMNLRREWVSRDGRVITFPAGEMKNGKPHEVPLIDVAREVVQRNIQIGDELKTQYPWLDEIEYVFVQRGPRRATMGKPLTQVTNRAWKNALKKAGLPSGIRFHDCRHTFATLHKRAGTDDRLIMHLGGWDSSKSMERYSHITTPDAERAARNLSHIWKG